MKTNEPKMVENLAHWVDTRTSDHISADTTETLKVRLLDSIGCAIGALGAEPIENIRKMTDELGGKQTATMIGGGKTDPVQATLYNGALVRYLDFNDSYLAKNETCHPSDNIAPLLAAAERMQADGKTFLLALAISYQVQSRLSDEAPVRDQGYDHTVQGQYAASAGAAKAFGMTEEEITNAIAIAGTAYNALRVTRTGDLSNWKGLAYPNTAMGAMHATLLAKSGITGPREVFEGNKGFMDTIAGEFELAWDEETLDSVDRTIIKKYNAEIHSQSAIEGLLELKAENGISPEDIDRIELETFDVAYNIIGGGEEGGKKNIRTKEEADHSLPYMLAVALLDGNVMPEQYRPERILREDVQNLLQNVHVTENRDYSARFPEEMACQVTLVTTDGERYSIEKSDYKGFHTRPATRESSMEKYNQLTNHIDPDLASDIAEVIWQIDERNVTDLTQLLEKISIKDGDNHENK